MIYELSSIHKSSSSICPPSTRIIQANFGFSIVFSKSQCQYLLLFVIYVMKMRKRLFGNRKETVFNEHEQKEAWRSQGVILISQNKDNWALSLSMPTSVFINDKRMPRHSAVSQILCLHWSTDFQEYDAPAHLAVEVPHCFDMTFPQNWTESEAL